ncbi:MAG: methylated-DNA--[protein]-cysteine S-methyltransferase [Cellulosilyticaceae bacterium]
MKRYYYTTQRFDIGEITIVMSHEGLEHLFLQQVGWETFQQSYQPTEDASCCKVVSRQLKEYFKGERRVFDLPLAAKGTAFQQQVWQGLQSIPYGETRTYGEIAQLINRPQAARAVGMANKANPTPIIIPCHRVVASGGKIGGYMGAYSHLKQQLLTLEKKGLSHT